MRTGREKDNQQEVVYGITDARKPLSQDIRSRESKYLMAMGIRIAAFLLIVIIPIDWPWKIGLAVLALVLPYVAVVYANGGREPEPGSNSAYQDPERRALTSGQDNGNGPGRPNSGAPSGLGQSGAEPDDSPTAGPADPSDPADPVDPDKPAEAAEANEAADRSEPIVGRIMDDDEWDQR